VDDDVALSWTFVGSWPGQRCSTSASG